MIVMPFSSVYGLVYGFLLILFNLNPVLTLSLRLRDDIRVDSKPVSLCEETPGVESHSGYIRLQSGVLNEYGIDSAQDYPVNIFFWYFQNRKKRTDSPLTVYFMGGPGASSLMSLFRENGPCRVNSDSNSTSDNAFSWNEHSDILYIDQPVQTGFSYDFAEPGVLHADDNLVLDRDSGETRVEIESGSRRGFFSSHDPRNTPNSTQVVARSTWFFLQVWMQKFGKRESLNNKINFWTSSYGGHFVPQLIQYTLARNARPSQGRLDQEDFIPLTVGVLGMTNACIDGPTQIPYYPEMALKNNYSAPLTDQAGYLTAIHNFGKSDGCLAKIQACRNSFTAADDKSSAASNVDDVCREANHYCGKHVASVATGRSYFDIAYPDNFLANPLSETYLGYLNQKHVQDALGVPVNFSANAPVVAQAFSSTGDNVKGGSLEALASILDAGVSVTMMYGDRDFACNWLGGEATSRAIPFSHSQHFSSAGIDDISMPGYPVGAQVRQAGNLSFIRVYSAGHNVGLQQPQLAQTILQRAIAGLDIASGTVPASGYSTKHVYKQWEHSGESLPFSPEGACYTWNLGLCSDRLRTLYLEGKTLVQDYFVVEDDKGHCVPNLVRPCARGNGWRGKELSETVVDVIVERQRMVMGDLRSVVMLLTLFSAFVGCVACLHAFLFV
ncbi:Alpha/Beta hydrolase protein [Xylaria flabelliformis]|nr:Alpha/Beta hydrolase protein [Xylaria flabelliformis]